MIPPDIQTVNLIIEIKSNDPHRSVGEKTKPIRKSGSALRDAAVKYILIIKMKGTVEGIGIGNNTRNDNNRYQQQIGMFIYKFRFPMQYHRSMIRKKLSLDCLMILLVSAVPAWALWWLV